MLPASLISNLGSESGRFDVNVVAAEGALHFELDGAVNEGVERVVLARADVVAGVELRAALTNDDAASVDGCIAENLHAKTLRLGVTTVAGGAAAFLVCHFICSAEKLG